MLKLHNLSFSYGGRPVFQGLNLTFPAGSRTAILGRSGLGKTTLLRLIAGLLPPDAGEITGLPEQGVAMVFQEDRLVPRLTAAENVRLPSPQLPQAELQQLFAELGLAGSENLLPAQLSGGMSRRVAIARALAFDSPLIMMDEPLKGLDETTHAQVMDCIHRRSGGKTLLLITHSAAEAEALGCKALQLKDFIGT